MKTKFLVYFLPLLVLSFMIYGFSNTDEPKNDSYSNEVFDGPIITPSQSDTTPPPGFPYARQFNWNYSTIPGVSGGTVGATVFNGKWNLNRWNALSTLYRYNNDGPGGGPGTFSDSGTYTGQIRDMTVAPDGSGTNYLWGGRAGTTLFKMNQFGATIASYIHTGASYRAIAWDPNRKGFWSSAFGGNIVCRDTAGNVKGTITTATTGKYGMGFDSSSTPGQAYLWVWEQGGTTANNLHKFSLATGTILNTYVFTLPGTSIGLAGGAEVYQAGGHTYLALNWQNFAVTAYRLTPANLNLALNFEACAQLDTITVELRSSTSPYALVQSSTGLGGLGTCQQINFPLAQDGVPYYIVVKHRNAIQTWSGAPVTFSGGNLACYDFTTADTQAFGSNMRLVGADWSFYQGDVNQDEIVDVSDVVLIYNDASNFVSGYVPTDLNCDEFVDVSDVVIAYNNSSNFVSVIKPL